MSGKARDPHQNLKPPPPRPPRGVKRFGDPDKVLMIFGWPVATYFALRWHLAHEAVSWGLVACALVLFVASQLALSAGYHRYFSHRSHAATPALEWFYLVFGAGGVQNSALKWANDHRRHHQHQDREEDPHPGPRGFWYCHIGWIIFAEKRRFRTYKVKDWESNPRVQWQHRHIHALSVLQTLILPLAVGWAFGAPVGGLALCGLAKVLCLQHATFSINSWGHTIGTRRFAPDVTATDSALLNFIVMGEGHHNFHHAFPRAYTLAYRWYHWEPTGWFTAAMARLGLASDLKTADRKAVAGRLERAVA
jgi:stearoyl-CoA desaturase (delta-9 desaturase)